MTIEQEMTSILFSKKTIKKVRKQFKKGPEKIPIEAFDITFRLYKATETNINLEALIIMDIENTEKEIDMGNLGIGVMHKRAVFFKPIGFYTLKKGVFTDDLNITVVREYEKEIDFLIQNKKVPKTFRINKLTLQQNAVIAAFSKETRLEAAKNIDRSLVSNGLMLDIYMTIEGYPEVFLDDKYGVIGAITKYRLYDKPWGIDPIVEYKEVFDKL